MYAFTFENKLTTQPSSQSQCGWRAWGCTKPATHTHLSRRRIADMTMLKINCHEPPWSNSLSAIFHFTHVLWI